MSQSIQYQKGISAEFQSEVKTAELELKSTWFSFEQLAKNRYGIMVPLLLIVGCMGGIAVGVGAMQHVFSLSVLALTTMTALSMMLAVAPIKAIIYTSMLAVVADIIIIAVNLIA